MIRQKKKVKIITKSWIPTRDLVDEQTEQNLESTSIANSDQAKSKLSQQILNLDQEGAPGKEMTENDEDEARCWTEDGGEPKSNEDEDEQD